MIKLGLLGKKLGHSLSPEIHRIILKELGLEGEYLLYEVEPENLEDKISEFKQSGIKGLNVTIPYKVSVMKFLDEISPEAQRIGAVNTITFSENILRGYNTDYFGIKATFKRHNVELLNKSVVIIGTGGAAASVFQCTMDLGAGDIRLVSRNPHENRDIWPGRGGKVISYEELEKTSGDIIINCTPVGMFPNFNESPVGKNIIEKFSTAFDLIYNPNETRFLKSAGELGLNCFGGLYMLSAQAVEAEKIWNEKEINDEIIEEIYLSLAEKI